MVPGSTVHVLFSSARAPNGKRRMTPGLKPETRCEKCKLKEVTVGKIQSAVARDGSDVLPDVHSRL